ncbi:MAG: zinc ABC transporter substrate-binding protein [Latescibacteria bacterium DG_63]|nr:MAG: zinc ABC transporter substrate-binding protein [Latescibacteria bacterium DG_63]
MRHTIGFIALLLAVVCVQPAQGELRVFACEPEWGALAEELGGNVLTVYTATTGKQDPHHIEARPSLLAKARQADLLICTGAELEIGWLPLLLRKTGNPRIQPGQPGYFVASDFVELREKPRHLDRSEGDIHASGNPHIQTDPHNIGLVADALAARLAELDPKNVEHYKRRYRDFSERWQVALERWNAQGAFLKGVPVVVHHKSWVYLEHWLGMREVCALEPKPGLPPNSGHLARVLSQLEKRPADLIIYAAYQDPRSAHWLSKKADVPAVALPFTVGGTKEAEDLFALYDDTLNRLLEATK